MSKNQRTSIDPVILLTLGIVFVVVAVGLAVFQSNPNFSALASDSGTMSQLIVAFVTGITTGGLSCLAVQGGLLASSLAHQIEQDYVEQVAQGKGNKRSKVQTPVRSNSALPIFLFLVAKLVAYTLLGALLGLLGSYLTLLHPVSIHGAPNHNLDFHDQFRFCNALTAELNRQRSSMRTDLQHDERLVYLHQFSGNPPLTFERLSKLEIHLFPNRPLIVLSPLERAIQTWR